MSTDATDSAVHTSIEVAAPPERAFHVFTAEMASWWDPGQHLLAAELAEMVCEPHVGGRILDRGRDGSESAWGTVLAYEPPHRFVFSWNISSSWTIESDPARCSEVEVTFIAADGGRTRVELVHRHLERHGDGWQGMRDAVGSPNGWNRGLGRFAAVFS